MPNSGNADFDGATPNLDGNFNSCLSLGVGYSLIGTMSQTPDQPKKEDPRGPAREATGDDWLEWASVFG
ncbi:MAG: hypothetical protein AB7S38_08250 [Vulcanimicrobiota bacterium]